MSMPQAMVGPVGTQPVPAARPQFAGTGGEMLVKVLLGMFLTSITLGIYFPWFIAGLSQYVYSRTTIQTPTGRLRVQFTGTGGSLFGTFIVGYLLTALTLGIYSFWFITNLVKYWVDNSTAVADDGTQYKLRYDGTGGGLFGALFVGWLLTAVTFGIYTPWFMCKQLKFMATNTKVLQNGQEAGAMDFVGEGGALFGEYIVGMILTVVTLGIYMFWFQCKISRFVARGTRAAIHGRTYGGDFTGTGGELFGIAFVGQLLTALTFGIYMPWLLAKVIRFNLESHRYDEVR